MLEIIAETVADAIAAEKGGASQIDLKSDFLEFGLTPSIGTLEQVRAHINIDINMMIRHFANSFVLNPEEVKIMCRDIALGSEFGANGFLLGALTKESQIDKDAIRRFQDAAGEIPLHFHLAWEMSASFEQALEDLIELGVKSVRTTGGQGLGGQVADSLVNLKRFQEQAADRIDLLLAGGVNHQNVGRLVKTTGIQNAHAGTSVREPQTAKGAVSEEKVHQLRLALEKALSDLTS